MAQTEHEGEGKCDVDDTAADKERYDKGYAFADEADADLDFVARLSDFLENTGFHDKMQTFLEDNCHVVDTTTDEHSHGYWEVFEAYQRRIDGILESFVEAEGLHDRSQMLRTIKAACTKFDFADDYIQQMLQTSEFPGFIELLKETWRDFAKSHNIAIAGDGHADGDADTAKEAGNPDESAGEAKANDSRSYHK